MSESSAFSPRESFPAGNKVRLGQNARQGGAALVHALLFVGLVAMMAGLAFQRGQALARDTGGERGRLRALYAAEGGLAKARHALRRDRSFVGTELQVDGCAVTVTVLPLGAGQWEITARSVCRVAGVHGPKVQVCLVEGFGTRYWYREL